MKNEKINAPLSTVDESVVNAFNPVIGYDEIKKELIRMADTVAHPEKYAKMGARMPSGVLLEGDPGLGKTLLSKCFLEACNKPCFTLRKDKPEEDFVEEITNTFDEAVKQAPSVILLDDMDKYSNEDDGHRNSDSYVTIQSCLDNVKGKNVFVIATVNEMHLLPHSLTRSGRLGKVLSLRAPKIAEAEKIIAHFLSEKENLASNINTKDIAHILDGYSCADLEEIINEACIEAAYAGKEQVEMKDIISASLRMIFDAPSSSASEVTDDTRKTAVHEAGHACTSEILQEGLVGLVSVCHHTGSIGGVTNIMKDDAYFSDIRLMENRIISILGGKAATEVVYGVDDPGAGNDLGRAMAVAHRFITSYAVNGLSLVAMHSPTEAKEAEIEKRVGDMLERLYKEAKRLLTLNRDFLDKVTNALMEKKTLVSSDIASIRSTCNIVK